MENKYHILKPLYKIYFLNSIFIYFTCFDLKKKKETLWSLCLNIIRPERIKKKFRIK